MPQRRRRLPAVWRGELAGGAAEGRRGCRCRRQLRQQDGSGSRAVEGEQERGSGEAVARKATLGQA